MHAARIIQSVIQPVRLAQGRGRASIATNLAKSASAATVLGTGKPRISWKDLTYQVLTSWMDGISRITGLGAEEGMGAGEPTRYVH
jgi:hypothetical protein